MATHNATYTFAIGGCLWILVGVCHLPKWPFESCAHCIYCRQILLRVSCCQTLWFCQFQYCLIIQLGLHRRITAPTQKLQSMSFCRTLSTQETRHKRAAVLGVLDFKNTSLIIYVAHSTEYFPTHTKIALQEFLQRFVWNVMGNFYNSDWLHGPTQQVAPIKKLVKNL